MPTPSRELLARESGSRVVQTLSWLMLIGCLLSAEAICAGADKNAGPTFERDIVPIFKAYCWHCHGGEACRAGLDLRTFPLVLRGGKSGPAIVRGSASESLVFKKFGGDLLQHPPETSRPTEAHLATLRAWIDAGAAAENQGGPVSKADLPPLTTADRSHWAFQTPVRPPVPRVVNNSVHTPVDAFLLKKLAERRLSFSPPADRATLIRRASVDLVGLPPTPQQVDEFLRDPAPAAFDRLVERLLASPHYGERVGRHWLDAAGYVDTRGTDNDAAIIEPLDGIWKYRDYVIRAFNDNRPYDRFLLEQIAGDELVDWRDADRFQPRDVESLIATGFLRQAADVTYAPELNTSDIRHQVVFDTIQNVTTNVLGLTVHCARCHTHKFDPISHADYYRIEGLFLPAYDPHDWLHSKERTMTDVPPRERAAIDAANASVDRQLVALRSEQTSLRGPIENRIRASKLASLAPARRKALLAAAKAPKAKRTEMQKALVAEFARVNTVTPDEIDRSLDARTKARRLELRRRIAALEKVRKNYGMIQALWDVGPAPPTYIFNRGDFQNPGPQIAPGVIAVLDDPAHPFQLPAAGKHGSTGYRTAFAKWLTSDRHPLTARVYVNRLWMHHFGRGIVPTPDNFGASGLPPSHPELLDWLAREFIASGWDVKHIQRLIVKSAAYQQASRSAADDANVAREKRCAEADPDNVLLWKMPLKRHESEIVRDAILAASGALETRMEGAPVPLKPNADGSVEIDTSKLRTPSDAARRSVYLFARRNYQLTELGVFDQPVVATNCTCRTSSAVVSQSLALLNGQFAFDQSRLFAERVERTAGPSASKQIETVFHIALGRSPSPEETQLAGTLLKEQTARHKADSKQTASSAALADLCQMILNTNEFLYSP
jgi:uncharacterized protein DUF1553/uncharacterized protein DUF1549/cytochrome c